MKGQSKLVEHILTVFLSILVLVGISALVYTFYKTALEREIRAELTQIAVQIKDNVIKLYDSGKNSKVHPSNFTSVRIGEVDLNLPDAVAKQNYEVSLITASSLYSYVTTATIGGVNISGVKQASGAKIVAKTIQDPVVTVEFDLPNIDVGVQGRIKNGADDVLGYYRYNQNTTEYDAVILGQPDIIVRISSIS